MQEERAPTDEGVQEERAPTDDFVCRKKGPLKMKEKGPLVMIYVDRGPTMLKPVLMILGRDVTISLSFWSASSYEKKH